MSHRFFFAVIDAIKMSMTFLFFMSMYNPAKSPPNPEDLRPFPHYVLAYWLAWPHNRMVLENTQVMSNVEKYLHNAILFRISLRIF